MPRIIITAFSATPNGDLHVGQLSGPDLAGGRTMQPVIYDFVGVGFGPANIALAVALEEQGLLERGVFLEQTAGPTWQPGMLIAGADIQNNPLRDLVTPRNPTSRYSFTNFLHAHDRLFAYLNLGVHFPLRKEFAQYVRWVARSFDRHVQYGREVQYINVDDSSGIYRVVTASGEVYRARAVVLAPGRTPFIPQVFAGALGDRVFHLNEYLPKIERILSIKPSAHLCVVGASQSAAEIVLDLYERFSEATITNLVRGFGYQLKDTSPFSEHVYFPEFVDLFYGASAEKKRALTASLRRTNYSSADADVIHKIYLALYEQRVDGESRLNVCTNSMIKDVRLAGTTVELDLEETYRAVNRTIEVDAVVLATGFRNFGEEEECEPCPPVMAKLINRIKVDNKGVVHVNRDYSLSQREHSTILPPIYVNGLCESSHGFGDAGSFSLLSLRALDISRSLADRLQLNQLRGGVEQRAGSKPRAIERQHEPVAAE
jgi:L-ornithine N5-oxygenase